MFDKGVIRNAVLEDIAVSEEMGNALRLWSDLYE